MFSFQTKIRCRHDKQDVIFGAQSYWDPPEGDRELDCSVTKMRAGIPQFSVAQEEKNKVLGKRLVAPSMERWEVWGRQLASKVLGK